MTLSPDLTVTLSDHGNKNLRTQYVIIWTKSSTPWIWKQKKTIFDSIGFRKDWGRKKRNVLWMYWQFRWGFEWWHNDLTVGSKGVRALQQQMFTCIHLLTDRHWLGSQRENLPQLWRCDRPFKWTFGGPEVGTWSEPHGHHRLDRPCSGGGSVLWHHCGCGCRVHAVQTSTTAASTTWHLDRTRVETVGAGGGGSIPCHAVNI